MVRAGLSKTLSASLSKAAPVLAVIATTLSVYYLELPSAGVSIVGDIPRGLPNPTLPKFDADLWGTLFLPALMIGVVGYVETISVAQTLAAKRRGLELVMLKPFPSLKRWLPSAVSASTRIRSSLHLVPRTLAQPFPVVSRSPGGSPGLS